MSLTEFVALVSGFDALAPRDKIRLFGWHLHSHKSVEVLTNANVRNCFQQIAADPPDISTYLNRMADARPADLVRVRGGYKLEGSVKRALDAKYGAHQSVVAISRLLTDLPAKIPDLAERAFLSEAISCYRVGAYRAAIVMTWNLAFDHLLNWTMADAARVAAFNNAVPKRYPRSKLVVRARENFEELKEAETIEVCYTAGLITKNVVEILRERLKRRNMAAHPSQIIIKQPQADDLITDLINNLVLPLK
jgi:hypothetical protein